MQRSFPVSETTSAALKNDGTVELDIRATTSQGDIAARSL
jgi:hypothetical protein